MICIVYNLTYYQFKSDTQSSEYFSQKCAMSCYVTNLIETYRCQRPLIFADEHKFYEAEEG